MRGVLRLVGGLVGLLFCCVSWAQGVLLHLDKAEAAITMDGITSHTLVRLPYGWDFHHKGHSGVARFALQFDAPKDPVGPWALYFYRLGNGYSVTLNGTLLEHNGDIVDSDGDTGDYAKIPRYLRIPPNVLMQHNRLEVEIRSDTGRRSGMPAVWAGPVGAVESLYRQEFAIRVGGSAVLAVFSLLVGIFAAVLWVSQTDPRPERRGMRDSVYLYAALAEFSWALFIGDTLIERPPLPWNAWSVVINMALGVWLASLLMFCHTIAGWEGHRASRWVKHVLIALLLAGPPVAYYAITTPLPALLTLWQVGFALVFVPTTVLFVVQALQEASTMHRVVALAFMVNVPIGIHDFYVMRIADPFTSQALLRYSATLFGLALGVIAIARFRAANLHVRDMLDTLAERIANKERELSQSYQRMERIAREQERTQERSRILRDMHDGVGSHISSAIRQLQSGRSNPEDVLLTLRDSLDQLKLSIDALNLPPGDITALLANLRYRLEPRFRAMGLALEWAVVPLDAVKHLDGAAMRQLQYIFFEAFSNVMQHAHASILRIEATPTLPSTAGKPVPVRIRICDNGCGFDPDQVPRKGLRSMQQRAASLGADLHITSRPGETVVELLLRQADGEPCAPTAP